ncbi:MAG: PilZ domain-containing protein [Candidatus Baltobacteraceae bacterium]
MSEASDPSAKNGEAPYRRRYVRVDVNVPVSYSREGGDAVKQGSSSDLGGGGIRLATDEDLPLGDSLLLRFRLPGVERELIARGRIVLSFYNSENKLFFHGIAFTRIDPRDQDEIVRYVAGEVQRLAFEGEPLDQEPETEGEPAD